MAIKQVQQPATNENLGLTNLSVRKCHRGSWGEAHVETEERKLRDGGKLKKSAFMLAAHIPGFCSINPPPPVYFPWNRNLFVCIESFFTATFCR